MRLVPSEKLHEWDALAEAGDGTPEEWFGVLFKAFGGVQFEVDTLAFMLGQTAAVVEWNADACLAMIEDRRTDLADLRAATAKLDEVARHILANIERNAKELATTVQS